MKGPKFGKKGKIYYPSVEYMYPSLEEEEGSPMEFNYEKFKALVHYICHMADLDKLGATKLNKILWYSDINFYINYGMPITGEVYKKEQWGPVPRDILRALDDLKKEGKLFVREKSFHGEIKKEYITLTEPDIGGFSTAEISLVAEVMHIICHHYTARSISKKSHDIIWELAEIGEEIPYHAIYGAPLGEIKQEYIEWAKAAIAANQAAYDMERFNVSSSNKGK